MVTTLTVLHPKGGVGRSTTVYMLGAELAMRRHRVALIDRDQGQHLSRVFDFYPPGVGNLVLGEDPTAALRIIDTAPEVNADRAVGYLREADWALVPVKGLRPAVCSRCRCCSTGSSKCRARVVSA